MVTLPSLSPPTPPSHHFFKSNKGVISATKFFRFHNTVPFDSTGGFCLQGVLPHPLPSHFSVSTPQLRSLFSLAVEFQYPIIILKSSETLLSFNVLAFLVINPSFEFQLVPAYWTFITLWLILAIFHLEQLYRLIRCCFSFCLCPPVFLIPTWGHTPVICRRCSPCLRTPWSVLIYHQCLFPPIPHPERVQLGPHWLPFPSFLPLSNIAKPLKLWAPLLPSKAPLAVPNMLFPRLVFSKLDFVPMVPSGNMSVHWAPLIFAIWNPRVLFCPSPFRTVFYRPQLWTSPLFMVSV